MAQATLTIDLGAISDNWRALDAQTGVETGAVVKADAYGLGAARVAPVLARAGARRFFVAEASEGEVVRDALGPGPEIYVFSGHMTGDTETLRAAGLIPLINSIDQLLRHVEVLPGAPFGIQLDSGMNRLGMEPAEWRALREIAMAQSPRLIMSHLACADEPSHGMNARQLAAFAEMTDGIDAPRSLSATGGLLLGAEYHFDLTRPGIGLYGGLPFEDARPVVQLDVPVIQIRDVAPGESVGYGNTFLAPGPRRIATLAAGYADGLLRAMGPKAQLLSAGRACPVVGRISMDLIGVDVTALDHTPETLRFLNAQQTVDDLADWGGTIGYEILTSLGARYDRVYRGP